MVLLKRCLFIVVFLLPTFSLGAATGQASSPVRGNGADPGPIQSASDGPPAPPLESVELVQVTLAHPQVHTRFGDFFTPVPEQRILPLRRGAWGVCHRALTFVSQQFLPAENPYTVISLANAASVLEGLQGKRVQYLKLSKRPMVISNDTTYNRRSGRHEQLVGYAGKATQFREVNTGLVVTAFSSTPVFLSGRGTLTSFQQTDRIRNFQTDAGPATWTMPTLEVVVVNNRGHVVNLELGRDEDSVLLIRGR